MATGLPPLQHLMDSDPNSHPIGTPQTWGQLFCSIKKMFQTTSILHSHWFCLKPWEMLCFSLQKAALQITELLGLFSLLECQVASPSNRPGLTMDESWMVFCQTIFGYLHPSIENAC